MSPRGGKHHGHLVAQELLLPGRQPQPCLLGAGEAVERLSLIVWGPPHPRMRFGFASSWAGPTFLCICLHVLSEGMRVRTQVGGFYTSKPEKGQDLCPSILSWKGPGHRAHRELTLELALAIPRQGGCGANYVVLSFSPKRHATAKLSFPRCSGNDRISSPFPRGVI